MKEILRHQYRYHKQVRSTNQFLSFLFAFFIAILSKKINLPNSVVIGLLVFFLIFVVYSNIKGNYFEDLFYSRILDKRERRKEPHFEIYMKIKNEKEWYKRVLYSYFGFGWTNWLPMLIIHTGMLFFVALILIQSLC